MTKLLGIRTKFDVKYQKSFLTYNLIIVVVNIHIQVLFPRGSVIKVIIS